MLKPVLVLVCMYVLLIYYNCIITPSKWLQFWYIKYLFVNLSCGPSLWLSHFLYAHTERFLYSIKSIFFYNLLGVFFVCVIFEVDAFKLSFRRRHSLARHAIFLFYVLGEWLRYLFFVVTQRWKIRCVTYSKRSHLTSLQFFSRPKVLQTSQVIIGCKWREIAQNSSVSSHRRDRWKKQQIVLQNTGTKMMKWSVVRGW